MHADAEPPTRTSPPRGGTRDRILDAANELFYAHGIRAVSADRIIEQVGITKVTFYRHFRSKSDLVVAYLRQQAEAEREWLEGSIREGDPLGSLRTIASGIGAASCRPGFRGCAFINAAAEFSDPDDPVREVVREHRSWMLGAFEGVAAGAQVEDRSAVARRLMLLRDGAMVSGYLGEPDTVADALGGAFAAVIAPVES